MVRLPAASERMGRPAASAKETAPEHAVDDDLQVGGGETMDAGRWASFQPVVMASWGTDVDGVASEEAGGLGESNADDGVAE